MDVKTICLILLAVMFVVFSALGVIAMKPQSSQRTIDAFWVSIIVFHVMLAVCLYMFISPILSVAPILPAAIFFKLFTATRNSKDTVPKDKD